jgi:hypothetical protein
LGITFPQERGVDPFMGEIHLNGLQFGSTRIKRKMTMTAKEEKITKVVLWIWRNILASGVALVCFWFLYDKCEDIEDNLIEVKTVLQERIRLERGDYGWAAPSYDEVEITEEMMERGMQAREEIQDFAPRK